MGSQRLVGWLVPYICHFSLADFSVIVFQMFTMMSLSVNLFIFILVEVHHASWTYNFYHQIGKFQPRLLIILCPLFSIIVHLIVSHIFFVALIIFLPLSDYIISIESVFKFTGSFFCQLKFVEIPNEFFHFDYCTRISQNFLKITSLS